MSETLTREPCGLPVACLCGGHTGAAQKTADGVRESDGAAAALIRIGSHDPRYSKAGGVTTDFHISVSGN